MSLTSVSSGDTDRCFLSSGFQNTTILTKSYPHHLRGLMTINGIVVSFIDFQRVYSKTTCQHRIAGLKTNGWLEKLSITFLSWVWHVSMLPRSIWTRQTQNLMTVSLVMLTLFKLICGYAYLSLELFILGYLRFYRWKIRSGKQLQDNLMV